MKRETLILWRKANGMTQKAAAKRLKIPFQTYKKWERKTYERKDLPDRANLAYQVHGKGF